MEEKVVEDAEVVADAVDVVDAEEGQETLVSMCEMKLPSLHCKCLVAVENEVPSDSLSAMDLKLATSFKGRLRKEEFQREKVIQGINQEWDNSIDTTTSGCNRFHLEGLH